MGTPRAVVRYVHDRNRLLGLHRNILLDEDFALLSGPALHIGTDPFGHAFNIFGTDFDSGVDL